MIGVKLIIGEKDTSREDNTNVFPIQVSLSLSGAQGTFRRIDVGKLIVNRNGVVLVNKNGTRHHLYIGDTIGINLELDI